MPDATTQDPSHPSLTDPSHPSLTGPSHPSLTGPGCPSTADPRRNSSSDAAESALHPAHKPTPDDAARRATLPDTYSARIHHTRTLLREILTDLTSPSAAPLLPLSRPRLLRWLPHVVVCAVALGIAVGGAHDQTAGDQLGLVLGTVIGFAQGVTIALALWRPVVAWWLSLGGAVVAAAAVREQMAVAIPDPGLGPARPLVLDPGPEWPWSSTAIIAHAFVLFFLALRVPTRVAVGALSVTALTTYFLEGIVGGQAFRSTGMLAVVVFAAVVLLGIALRGRTQLVEQASQTEEERARRTLLEERSRIARELHDVVAHHMSVISIQAQVAPHLVENPSEELKENLEGIRQNALEALTELRRVLGVLRSENPEDPYGLGAGTGAAPNSPQPTLDRLDALVENTRAAGLEVATEITGEQLPLPPGVELSAYRIIQEALSNALRHAPGSVVRVELWHFPRGLQVRVINSRPQRPAPPSPGAGHGLLGMRERAAMLGGTLVTSETSHGGFVVAAFLPRNGVASTDEDSSDDRTSDDRTTGDGSTDDSPARPTGEETP